jgi:DNA-directed RNA polymerase specialized sigma24 family protein
MEIDLAAIDTARILKCSQPEHQSLFEEQMKGFTPEEIATRRGVSTTAIRGQILSRVSRHSDHCGEPGDAN